MTRTVWIVTGTGAPTTHWTKESAEKLYNRLTGAGVSCTLESGVITLIETNANRSDIAINRLKDALR